MARIIKLGRARASEIMVELVGDEPLSLYFYNRRIGLILPMPHQAIPLTPKQFWVRVIDLAREGQVSLSRGDIVGIAQELLEKFTENGEEIK